MEDLLTAFTRLGEFLQNFLEFMAAPAAPGIVVSSIVLLAITSYYFFLIQPLEPIKKNLSKSLKALKSIPLNKAAFFDSFEGIRSDFLNNKYLKDSWEEFEETLIIGQNEKVIFNTRRPHEYFNERHIIFPHINYRLIENIPNFLVGLGLLITFAGLVAALHIAAQSGAGDSEIQHLLKTASTKFLASIAGLGSSIIFSYRKKKSLDSVSKLVADISRCLEQRLEFITVESIVRASLEEHKKQNNKFDSIAAQIAIALEEALSKSLPSSFTTALNPLLESFNALQGKITNVNQDALQRMIGEFNEKISGAANGQITQLVEGLGKVQENLTDLIEKMSKSGDEFGSKVNSAAGEVADKLIPITTNLGHFEQSMFRISNDLNNQSQIFAQNIESLNTTLESIKSAGESLKGAAKPIQFASDSISSASNSMQQTSAVLQSTYEACQQLHAQLTNLGDKLTQVWNEYGLRFEKVDQDLSNSFTQMTTGLIAFRDGAQKFVGEFNGSFEKAISSLSGAIHDLAEVVEESREAA